MANPYDPIKENILYPLDNPNFAVNNAMSDVGVNPYTANPFTASIKRLGRPLANAYTSMMATDKNTTAYATANQGPGTGQPGAGGSAIAFSDYLRNAMSPNRGQQQQNYSSLREGTGLNLSGGLHPTIGSWAQNVPGVIQQVRDYRNGLNAGTVNGSNLNPFMARLSDQLGASGGQGTADYIADLHSMYMAPSMQNAYRNALTTLAQQSTRRLAEEPLTTNKDIWSFMLGV